ncbi:carbapenem susceptibility porin CarO [Kaistia algarum]|nr:carbapenem susceptibility porin CarO [Kaistia algarum]
MKKLGLATALLLAMTGAQAYQFEVQGQSEYVDTTENDKNFTGAVQGTYYFKNVDSSKGPLAEAAFLNQASNVSLAYQYGQYDAPVEEGRSDIESHVYGAKAEAYVPTKFVPAYASASYSHTHTDGKNSVTRDDNGDRYALELGAVKYVGNIDGTNMALGLEAGLVYGEHTAYQLKTDLYLTPALSVGASYAESSFDDLPNKAWGANVNYFITPAIAVGASYVNANAENANLDTQSVGVNAKFRF